MITKQALPTIYNIKYNYDINKIIQKCDDELDINISKLSINENKIDKYFPKENNNILNNNYFPCSLEKFYKLISIGSCIQKKIGSCLKCLDLIVIKNEVNEKDHYKKCLSFIVYKHVIRSPIRYSTELYIDLCYKNEYGLEFIPEDPWVQIMTKYRIVSLDCLRSIYTNDTLFIGFEAGSKIGNKTKFNVLAFDSNNKDDVEEYQMTINGITVYCQDWNKYFNSVLNKMDES